MRKGLQSSRYAGVRFHQYRGFAGIAARASGEPREVPPIFLPPNLESFFRLRVCSSGVPDESIATLCGMSTEEIYSINGASTLTGYSVPTIRKRLDVLKKAGAIQTGLQWEIPLSALHAAKLMSKVNGQTSESVTQKKSGEVVNILGALQVQLDEALRREEIALLRAEHAEAIAAERLKALDRADRTMLMLEELRAENVAPDPVTQTGGGWFRRRRRG